MLGKEYAEDSVLSRFVQLTFTRGLELSLKGEAGQQKKTRNKVKSENTPGGFASLVYDPRRCQLSHPEYEMLVQREKRRITLLREKRRSLSRVTDRYRELNSRLEENARKVLLKREQEERERIREEQHHIREVSKAFRRKVGGLRRRKHIDAYTRLLLALYDTQLASDQAKSRAANDIHFDDYEDHSGYAAANYRRSRLARDADYMEKERHLRDACSLAKGAGICFGYQESDTSEVAPYVIYFELKTGQVSFHTADYGSCPAYHGQWDGQHISRERIMAAIAEVIDGRGAGGDGGGDCDGD